MRYGTWQAVIAFSVSAAWATGAFAQSVTIEFDKSVDFSKFKTFAIRDGEIRSPSPALNSKLTKKRVEGEIESALTARGLTKATGTPDMNVFYTLGSLQKYPPAKSGSK
jgi:hypothetical protein